MDFDVTRAIPVNNSNERQPAFDINRAILSTEAPKTAPTLKEAGSIAVKNLKETPMRMLEETGKVLNVIRWPFWRFIEHPVTTIVSAAQEPKGKTVGGTLARAAQAYIPFRKIPKEEYGTYGKVWDRYFQDSRALFNQPKMETPGWYIALASYGSAVAVENPAIGAAAKITELATTRVATAEEANAIRSHFARLKTGLERRGLNPKDLHSEGNIIKVDDKSEIFINKYLTAVLKGDQVRIPRWSKVKIPSNVSIPEAKGTNIIPKSPDIFPVTGPEIIISPPKPIEIKPEITPTEGKYPTVNLGEYKVDKQTLEDYKNVVRNMMSASERKLDTDKLERTRSILHDTLVNEGLEYYYTEHPLTTGSERNAIENNIRDLISKQVDFELSTPTGEGQKPPIEPPKTAVSGAPAPEKPRLEPSKSNLTPKVITTLTEKLAGIESTQERAELTREYLSEMNSLRKEFKNRIRKYKGGYLAEELESIPKYYRKAGKTGGISPDEAMQSLRERGIDIQDETALADYLKSLDAERNKLLSELEEAPGMVSLKETTLIKKELQAAKTAAREGKILTKEEIKGVQEDLINLIEDAGIPAEYKGRFLRTIKNIQTQGDLSKAIDEFAGRIDELSLRVQKENLVDDIGKVKTEGIAIDYATAIEGIKEQFDLKNRSAKTFEKRAKIKAYVERMRAKGQPVTIPEDKLALIEKKTLNEMTIEELEGLRDEIQHLSRLGKTKLAAQEAVYTARKEKIKASLLEDAHAINSKVIPRAPIGKTTPELAKRYVEIMNQIRKTKIGLTPMDGLADITGMGKMKDTLDAKFADYLTFNDTSLEKWYDLTKDLDEGNMERIGTYAMAQQEGGLERLANSGITKEEISAIKLTPQEKAVYDFARETFDKYFPQVKQYTREIYNEDVGKVSNYVSYMSDFEQMSDLELYDRFGTRPQEAIDRKTKTVERGFTEKRTTISKIKLQLNIDKIFRRHMDDVAYLLTTGKDIKMYYEIVNSPEMREALGDLGAISWLQWLDLMARKGGIDGAKKIAVIDIMRRNIGAGVLGFRLSSALIQFSSFGDAMATIGADWTIRGAKNIATSKEWRNFIMDNFPEIRKAVGDDIAFRELGAGILEQITKVSMKPLQALDGLMRTTAASGALEMIAARDGKVIDFKNPDPAMIQEANKLMRESQGSSFFKDQPLAITAGYGLTDNRSVNKLILTFQSFMLNRWDNINRQIWRLGIKEKDFGKAFWSLFWLVTVGLAGEEALRRGSRGILSVGQQKKRKEDSFSQGVILNALQAVPLLGQLVSAITYAGNPVPVINTAEDVLEGIGSAIKGKENKTKLRGAVRAAGAAGALMGIPGASQAAQIIEQRIPKKSKTKIRD